MLELTLAFLGAVSRKLGSTDQVEAEVENGAHRTTKHILEYMCTYINGEHTASRPMFTSLDKCPQT